MFVTLSIMVHQIYLTQFFSQCLLELLNTWDSRKYKMPKKKKNLDMSEILLYLQASMP